MSLTTPTKRGSLGKCGCAAVLIGLLVAAVATAAMPAAAGQDRTTADATVSVSVSTIFYRAAAGQTNHVVIQSGGIGNQFSISDSGATLHAGPGCSGGPGAVLCVVPSGGLPAYDVDLGDGNDTFDVRANFPQRSVVNGGFGDDTFSGGPGAETFFGGDGVDTVTYASRTVTIGGSIGCDSGGLFCAPDGAQNENDSISNDIEKVIGGSGADGLASGPKTTVRHTLDGGAGNDFIAGNLGSDVLTGGSGQDTLSGFDGNDSLFARDGEPDTLSCGTGLDVAQIDLHDPPPPADCDSVDRAAVDQGPNVRIGPVRLAARVALVRLTCPQSPEGRCAGTLSLRRIVGTRGSAATATTKSTLRLITRLLGSARYQIAIGYAATVHVPVAGVASGRIQVISVEPDANGRPKTTLATRTLQR